MGTVGGRYFKVSSEMFNCAQVRALAWPLKDILIVAPKLLVNCLGCVFRVIVLSEVEYLARSGVLDQIFIEDTTILFSFPSTSLIVSTFAKHLHSIILEPSCFSSHFNAGSL